MANDLKKLFGARVRALRQAAGLTAEELAKRARLDTSWLCRIERGEKETSFGKLSFIAEGLGVDEMDLLTFPEATVRHVINDLTRQVPLDVNLEIKRTLEAHLGIARPAERRAARNK